MFYEKFAVEGNKLLDNPNIYNVEGDNKLTNPDNQKCVENPSFFLGVL